jgi:predicted metal-dependent hydrolase
MKRAGREAEIELLDGRRVPLKLSVNPRARRVSVRICAVRREAIATAPSERHLSSALKFAAERAHWIAEELARLPEHRPFKPGVLIPIRGEPHLLAISRERGQPRLSQGLLTVPTPDPDLFAGRVRRFLMSQARKALGDRAAVHAQRLGVRINRLQVKDTRSRWGSCSLEGSLSFSWRIIFAPSFVLDYLAAHEVAHLRQMNHSRRFWALVAKCTPHWRSGRDWLHEHGMELHAIGGP